MGLDIFFREDIRNALLAANEASASTAAVIAGPTTPCEHTLPKVAVITCATCRKKEYYVAANELLAVRLRVYREGYKAALTTVALAFGLSPQTIPSQLADILPAVAQSVPLLKDEERG